MGKVYYDCIRYFCSLECALAFYLAHFRHNDDTMRETGKLLREIHAEVQKALGQPISELQPAQDWNLLQIVGSATWISIRSGLPVLHG